MDLYHSSGTTSNRVFGQQRHGGGHGVYRFAPNGQLTNGPSLLGNSANINSMFGSNLHSYGSSGNQFNFPLQSNRSSPSSGFTNQRPNAALSVARNSTHNQNYGIFSKPSTSSRNNTVHYYNSSGNGFVGVSRSNQKVRRTQSQAITSRELTDTTASLERTVLNDHDQSDTGNSSETQYRIFKRGDSYPGETSASQLNQERREQNYDRNSSDFGNQQELPDSGADGVSLPSTSTAGLAKTFQSQNNNRMLTHVHQNSRTPVSLVAEIARFHGLTSEYRLVNEAGPPHCPVFTVLLHLGGESHEGVGPSIKKAQSAAATVALENTTLPKPPPRSTPVRRNYQPWMGAAGPSSNRNPNWPSFQLAALAEELNQSLHFVNHPINSIDHYRKVTPATRVAAHIGDRIFCGEGNSFHAAKNMASLIALKALTTVKNESRAQDSKGAENDEEDESKSPISIVYEMALKRSMGISYETIKEVGPAHMKVFTVQCKVGEEFMTESEGLTKQQAKKLASEQMIAKLKEVPVSGDSVKSFQRNLLLHKIVKRKAAAPVLKDVDKASVSPISRLIQIAHLRKYKEPEFTVVVSSTTEEVVEPQETQVSPANAQVRPNKRNPRLKKPHFVIEVKVGSVIGQGEGPNKKAAKKSAADHALVQLGYPPSPSQPKEPKKVETKPGKGNLSNVATTEGPSSSKSSTGLKVISGRSLVPGILVIQNHDRKIDTKSDDQNKTGEIDGFLAPATAILEGVNKLSYLAQLLGVTVSYSDFPKKNEFLSVVSLATNPPQVSHGIGPTLEDARNNAALQVLAELSDKGIENDSSSDIQKENEDITH